jgi:hypothetical protein
MPPPLGEFAGECHFNDFACLQLISNWQALDVSAPCEMPSNGGFGATRIAAIQSSDVVVLGWPAVASPAVALLR